VVGAKGRCPHCGCLSLFLAVTSGHLDGGGLRICNGAQCQACKQFILVVGNRISLSQQFALEAVYPLEKPNDQVDESVPSNIREDFREGLRCRWAGAHRATLVMCRRAIQSSCLELKAQGERLTDQIDDLAARGKITQALQEMAHEVRLAGSEGAHPDRAGLSDATQKDADDIIAFTREYLQHVYVMPAQLEARRAKGASAGSGA